MLVLVEVLSGERGTRVGRFSAGGVDRAVRGLCTSGASAPPTPWSVVKSTRLQAATHPQHLGNQRTSLWVGKAFLKSSQRRLLPSHRVRCRAESSVFLVLFQTHDLLNSFHPHTGSRTLLAIIVEMASEEGGLSSAFPPPPKAFEMFTSENIEAFKLDPTSVPEHVARAMRPPEIPSQAYSVFGDTWPVRSLLGHDPRTLTVRLRKNYRPCKKLE